MKRIVNSFLLLVFVGLAGNVCSQPIVQYPNPAYLHWEEANGFDNYYVAGFGKKDDVQRENYFPALPFYSPGGGTVTVYGVAVHLHEYAEEEITINDVVELSIYEATVGESELRLVKSQSFPVSRGQTPDLYLRYRCVHPSSNHLDVGLYEFYFDTPLQLDGSLYFIGFKSESGNILFRQHYTEKEAGRFSQGYMGCSPSYTTFWVDTKSLRPIQYQNRCYDDDGNETYVFESNPDGLPILPPEETFCWFTQGMLPIIQPKGYLSVPQSMEESDGITSRLVPNPAHDEVTLTAESAITRVAVYDMQGHLVLEQQAHGREATLSLRKLAAGSYIVHADTPRGRLTHKLTVE